MALAYFGNEEAMEYASGLFLNLLNRERAQAEAPVSEWQNCGHEDRYRCASGCTRCTAIQMGWV